MPPKRKPKHSSAPVKVVAADGMSSNPPITTTEAPANAATAYNSVERLATRKDRRHRQKRTLFASAIGCASAHGISEAA